MAGQLDRIGVSYLHLAEADWDDAPQVPEQFRHELRNYFKQTIIVAGGYDPERADWIIQANLADLVAFGRPFIANPDYPQRVRQGWPLAEFKADYLFGGAQLGYSDFANYVSAE